MRILIAHESIATRGGVESYLGAILPELSERGHQIAVVYHQRSGRTDFAPSSSVRTWASGADLIAGVEDYQSPA